MVGRYRGSCEPLCSQDVSALASWIAAIPLDEWPQRDRMRADYPYPAMVSNPDWHGFKSHTDAIVDALMAQFPDAEPDHRMLSIVVPGQRVEAHTDQQSERWRARLHLPLLTNPQALFTINGSEHHLKVGTVYLVNPDVEHSVANNGDAPRVHFFFDVRERT